MPSLFISHSYQDKEAVNRLSQILSERNIDILLSNTLSDTPLAVGDSLVQEIPSALENADFVLVIISSHSLASEWVRREVDFAIANEISHRKMNILPLLLEDVEIPGFLRGRLYADLSKGINYAADMLIKAMGVDPLNSRARRGPEDDSSENFQKLQNDYTFSNFVFGNSNYIPYCASLAIASDFSLSPNCLHVQGGVGLGKTHLLQSICRKLSATGFKFAYMSSETLTSLIVENCRGYSSVYNSLIQSDALIIDDIQFLLGKRYTMEEIQLLISRMTGDRKKVVLSSDRPLEQTMSFLPGIEFVQVTIQSPGISLRRRILEKKSKAIGIDYKLPAFAIDFIAQNFSTNIRELEGIVNRLCALWRFSGKEPTLKDLEALLQDHLETSWIRSPEDRLNIT